MSVLPLLPAPWVVARASLLLRQGMALISNGTLNSVIKTGTETGPWAQTVELSSVLIICQPILNRISPMGHSRLEPCQPQYMCGSQVLSYISHLRDELSPDPRFQFQGFSVTTSFRYNSWLTASQDISLSELSPDSSVVSSWFDVLRIICFSCADYDWDWGLLLVRGLRRCLQISLLSFADSDSVGERVARVGIPWSSFCLPSRLDFSVFRAFNLDQICRKFCSRGISWIVKTE